MEFCHKSISIPEVHEDPLDFEESVLIRFFWNLKQKIYQIEGWNVSYSKK